MFSPDEMRERVNLNRMKLRYLMRGRGGEATSKGLNNDIESIFKFNISNKEIHYINLIYEIIFI